MTCTEEHEIDIVQLKACLKCLVIELRRKANPDPVLIGLLLDQAEGLIE